MHFPRPIRGTSVLVAGALGALLASSCSMNNSGDARVVLKIPSTTALSSKVGAFTYSWDRACFAMNVTAGDIPSAPDSQCDVKRGVFAGTAGSGQTLSAQVTKGVGRKLELFAYFRPSAAEPCPALNGGFGTLNRSMIVRVGLIQAFDISSDEVNLSVDVSLPAAGTSVLSQYSMPNSCSASNVASTFASRLVAGAGQSTSAGGFVIRQRVSFKPEEKTLESLSGSGHKLKGALSMEGP